MRSVEFDVRYRYELASSGIIIPIELVSLNERIALTARLDTGCSDCLFDRSYAELLGIDVESGLRSQYRTVTGFFQAFGHEVTLNTLGLEWSAMVFFYAASDPEQNFVGRRGWLDRVRLALVHYDQDLYLALYNR